MGNLAGSLGVLRRWGELEDVTHATLPRSPYQEDMRLWELLLLARRADPGALGAALNRCHEWQPDPWMKPLLEALRAYLALAQGAGSIAALVRAVRVGGPRQARAVNRELARLALERYTPWSQRWRWWVPG